MFTLNKVLELLVVTLGAIVFGTHGQFLQDFSTRNFLTDGAARFPPDHHLPPVLTGRQNFGFESRFTTSTYNSPNTLSRSYKRSYASNENRVKREGTDSSPSKLLSGHGHGQFIHRRLKRQASHTQHWDFHPSSLFRQQLKENSFGLKRARKVTRRPPGKRSSSLKNASNETVPVVRGNSLLTESQEATAGAGLKSQPADVSIHMPSAHFNALLQMNNLQYNGGPKPPSRSDSSNQTTKQDGSFSRPSQTTNKVSNTSHTVEERKLKANSLRSSTEVRPPTVLKNRTSTKDLRQFQLDFTAAALLRGDIDTADARRNLQENRYGPDLTFNKQAQVYMSPNSNQPRQGSRINTAFNRQKPPMTNRQQNFGQSPTKAFQRPQNKSPINKNIANRNMKTNMTIAALNKQNPRPSDTVFQSSFLQQNRKNVGTSAAKKFPQYQQPSKSDIPLSLVQASQVLSQSNKYGMSYPSTSLHAVESALQTRATKQTSNQTNPAANMPVFSETSQRHLKTIPQPLFTNSALKVQDPFSELVKSNRSSVDQMGVKHSKAAGSGIQYLRPNVAENLQPPFSTTLSPVKYASVGYQTNQNGFQKLKSSTGDKRKYQKDQNAARHNSFSAAKQPDTFSLTDKTGIQPHMKFAARPDHPFNSNIPIESAVTTTVSSTIYKSVNERGLVPSSDFGTGLGFPSPLQDPAGEQNLAQMEQNAYRSSGAKAAKSNVHFASNNGATGAQTGPKLPPILWKGLHKPTIHPTVSSATYQPDLTENINTGPDFAPTLWEDLHKPAIHPTVSSATYQPDLTENINTGPDFAPTLWEDLHKPAFPPTVSSATYKPDPVGNTGFGQDFIAHQIPSIKLATADRIKQPNNMSKQTNTHAQTLGSRNFSQQNQSNITSSLSGYPVFKSISKTRKAVFKQSGYPISSTRTTPSETFSSSGQTSRHRSQNLYPISDSSKRNLSGVAKPPQKDLYLLSPISQYNLLPSQISSTTITPNPVPAGLRRNQKLQRPPHNVLPRKKLARKINRAKPFQVYRPTTNSSNFNYLQQSGRTKHGRTPSPITKSLRSPKKLPNEKHRRVQGIPLKVNLIGIPVDKNRHVTINSTSNRRNVLGDTQIPFVSPSSVIFNTKKPPIDSAVQYNTVTSPAPTNRNPFKSVSLWVPSPDVPVGHPIVNEWRRTKTSVQKTEPVNWQYTPKRTKTASRKVEGGQYVMNWFNPRKFQTTKDIRHRMTTGPIATDSFILATSNISTTVAPKMIHKPSPQSIYKQAKIKNKWRKSKYRPRSGQRPESAAKMLKRGQLATAQPKQIPTTVIPTIRPMIYRPPFKQNKQKQASRMILHGNKPRQRKGPLAAGRRRPRPKRPLKSSRRLRVKVTSTTPALPPTTMEVRALAADTSREISYRDSFPTTNSPFQTTSTTLFPYALSENLVSAGSKPSKLGRKVPRKKGFKINAKVQHIQNNTNLTEKHQSNRSDQKRNRTIAITKEVRHKTHPTSSDKGNFKDGQVNQIVGKQNGSVANDYHGPAIGTTNVPPSAVKNETAFKSSNTADILRLLEALQVLQSNVRPPTTMLPPMKIVVQVEHELRPRKLTCRCFPKSDGCPTDLKEEPLMDMCDVLFSIPCCEDS